MSKRNLLICFDAFGTLFTPKTPVHLQYAEVAHALGLGPFSEASVKTAFSEAYRKESKQHPNFGKANGMNAEQWWTNIIHNTFQPLVGKEKTLPRDLAPRLLNRFWTDEGYKLMPDVQSLFQQLRSQTKAKSDGSLVVGVVTNSDSRVPDTLASLGLQVGPLRYGDRLSQRLDLEHDINFAIMSFDVGHEKPDERIFKAAEELPSNLTFAASSGNASDMSHWQKVYVGDEYEKDVQGAVNAGWNAVLIGPYQEVSQHSDVKWLDDQPAGNVFDVFDSCPSVGFSRLGKLAEWWPLRSSSAL